MTLDKSSLANEIFTLQRKFDLPGFVKEGRQLLERFSLPKIIDEVFRFLSKTDFINPKNLQIHQILCILIKLKKYKNINF